MSIFQEQLRGAFFLVPLVASDVTATINEKHTLQSRKPFSTGEAWLFNGTLVDEK